MVLFTSVPEIGAVPLAGIPVTFTRLSLVHVKVVPATVPVGDIVVIGEPEQTVCGENGLHPAIFGTVNVPVFGQVAVLFDPLIQPEAITTPLHLTSHKQELSLKVPCASMKKVNGAFTDGVVPDGVTPGLNPYGPPFNTTAFSELVSVHVISSAQLPLPVMIT